MKKFRIILVCMLFAMCALVGCDKGRSTDFQVDDSEIIANPFEVESEEGQKTETAGSLAHGIVLDENAGDTIMLQYNGGQMEVPYFANASGIATSCGFHIYIDGIPQPYKVKGVDEAYQYMQILEFEDSQDQYFTFTFTPVTGNKGENLSICIVSIIDPTFEPDMVETFGYGHSHKSIEAIYPMEFLNDTDANEAKKEIEEADTNNMGQNLSITETKLTQDELSRYTESELNISLDKDVVMNLSIDDEDMWITETYNYEGKDTLHIKYKIMGHPGVEYKTSFYLNHQPITMNQENSFDSILKNGEVEVIEFDLDVSSGEFASFYVISVPCNKDDYPDDAILSNTMHSILLYSKAEVSKQNASSEKGEAGTKGKTLPVKLNDFDDIITVQYADENHIFIVADKVYLYDLYSNTVLCETENIGYTERLQVTRLTSGYAMIDTDVSNNKICTYYDESLTFLEKVNINEVFGFEPRSIQKVAVSKNGNDIATVDRNGLYLCNKQKKSKQEVLFIGDLDYESRKGINGIDSIVFADNDKKISFIGQRFSLPIQDGVNGISAYGSMNLDGSNLVVEDGYELSKLQSYDEFVILSEELTIGGAAGEAYIYFVNTGETNMVTLKEKKESGNVWGSDCGSYIMTAVPNKNGWTIRLYRTADGELINEWAYENNDTESYLEPCLYMIEEYNIILLYFRPYGENEQYMMDEISF